MWLPHAATSICFFIACFFGTTVFCNLFLAPLGNLLKFDVFLLFGGNFSEFHSCSNEFSKYLYKLNGPWGK